MWAMPDWMFFLTFLDFVAVAMTDYLPGRLMRRRGPLRVRALV